MPTEIIFALVLATVFLGAIGWLVVYSRLRHRRTARAVRRPAAVEPAALRVRSSSDAGRRER